MNSDISKNWSEAYFLILQDNCKEKIQCFENEKEKLFSLYQIFSEFPGLLNYLQDYFVSIKEKKEFLEETLKILDKDLSNFIWILINENLFIEFNRMLELILKKLNRKVGIKECLVFSTEKLKEEILEKIKQKLSKDFTCKIEIKNVIDTKLVGGILVKLENQIFDYSIRGILQNLYKEVS